MKLKWQTDRFTTERVLHQLQLEPKVIVPSYQSSNAADHNVPDLSNIANYVECTSTEDIYLQTELQTDLDSSIVHTKKKDEGSENNIEEELAKMFNNENEQISFPLKTKTDLKKKRKISKKKKNVQELLIQLFGNNLDDVGITSPKKIVQNRRHTLPVSINISEGEFFQPLRIDQKRKSETEIDTSFKKIQSASTQVLNIDYSCAPDLITPKIFSDFANITITEEFYSATIKDKPHLETSESMANSQTTDFIDLTDDNIDHGISVLEFDGIRVEIRTDVKPESSEQAGVPVSKPSMPLLSPVSPTEPTQTEAVLPQGSTQIQQTQRPPPVQKQKSLEAALPQSSTQNQTQRPSPVQKQKSLDQTGQKRKRQKVQQQKSTEEARVFSQRQNSLIEQLFQKVPQVPPQPDKTNTNYQTQAPPQNLRINQPHTNYHIQAPPQDLRLNQPDKTNTNYQIQFPPNRNLFERQSNPVQQFGRQNSTLQPQRTSVIQNIQPATETPLNQRTTFGGQCRVNQNYQATTRQQPPVTQPNYQATTRQPPEVLSLVSSPPQQTPLNQFPPQLLRLLRTPVDFYPISNIACAEKIYPHILKFIQYTKYVKLFETNVGVLFDDVESRNERMKFYEYWQNIVLIFGRKLLKDFALISVPNFNLSQVLVHLTTKLMESGQFCSTIKTFNYIKLMIERLEDKCNTPFLQSLFKSVKASSERMEQRAVVPKFTVVQLKQLETQIIQYGLINKWLHSNLQKQSQQNKKSTPAYQQSTQNNNNNNEHLLSEISAFLASATRSDNVPSTTRTSAIETSVEVPPPPQKTNENRPVENTESTHTTSTIECSTVTTTGTFFPSDVNTTTEQSSSTTKTETKVEIGGEVIDLTWIDDCDDNEIMEEIIECKTFPFKVESCAEEKTTNREVVSPADSGLGSPVAQHTTEDYRCLKCLCGNKAIYVCACNSSVYCSNDCQIKDWVDHQRLCHQLQS